MGINRDNFYLSTYANFTRCDREPDREPDYESLSGSRYWYDELAVIRASDHWGDGIRSCAWYVDGESYGYGMHAGGHGEFDPICAACRWEDFRRMA